MSATSTFPSRITLAITGGIAIYKICDLVRQLKKQGVDVRVAMTRHATHFVTPMTFEALSGHPVALTEWEHTEDGPMPHIALNLHADLLLVAPATANTIAKAAHGIADDLVSSLMLAHRHRMAIVPAMNTFMWNNPATQRNIETLRQDGIGIFGPALGEQACGDVGQGRMLRVQEILEEILRFMHPQPLRGHRILLTAGPTFEPIDTVRGITNRSSGQQGYALAQAFARFGARVTLISGPTALPTPYQVRRIDITTAQRLYKAVHQELDHTQYDAFVGVAAVADWRIQNPLQGKYKKSTTGMPALRWVENPDILASVAHRQDRPITIGFAAECQDILPYARAKLQRKQLDAIVANDASLAIGSQNNQVHLLTPDARFSFATSSKRDIAEHLIEKISQLFFCKNHER